MDDDLKALLADITKHFDQRFERLEKRMESFERDSRTTTDRLSRDITDVRREIGSRFDTMRLLMEIQYDALDASTRSIQQALDSRAAPLPDH